MRFHDRCRPRGLPRLVLLLAIGVVLTVPSSAWAQSAAVNSKNKQLRQPTPAEIKVLTDGMRRMLSRDATGLALVKHPNGAESMDLQGRFMNLEVVKIDSDGKVSGQCVNNVEEARRFLTSESKAHAPSKKPANPPAVLEEK
jgi:hypothetical protein